jgi:hypothetical protein
VPQYYSVATRTARPRNEQGPSHPSVLPMRLSADPEGGYRCPDRATDALGGLLEPTSSLEHGFAGRH